ncbi:MAG: hypothetical protein VB861_09625 [Planctomycetaceae bacterium]
MNCSIKRLVMCGVLCAMLAWVSVTAVAQDKPAAVSAAAVVRTRRRKPSVWATASRDVGDVMG